MARIWWKHNSQEGGDRMVRPQDCSNDQQWPPRRRRLNHHPQRSPFGTQEEWRVPTNNGLEEGQSWSGNRPLQDGNTRGGSEIPEERVLGNQNRPRRRIFSYPHPSKFKKVARVHLERTNIPIYSPSIRAQSSTMDLHKGDETSCQKVAFRRNDHLYLHRRHFGARMFSRRMHGNYLKSHSRLKMVRLPNQGREMRTDTDSTNHISGNSFGFPTRIVQNSGGQTTDCNPSHHQNTNSIPPKIPSLTKMDLSSDWQTSIPFDCSPSHPSVPLSSSNQHDECSPSKRMESLDANHERSNERSDSITVSNSGEQRNTFRNGMESSGRQYRRKSTRLWSPFKRTHSLRNVERRHENSPHQQSRIESSPHVLSDCHDSSSISTRDSVPSSNRQHDSSSLHTQGLWSSLSLGEHCKSNLDSPTETKMVNSQGFLHSVRKKSNRRSVVKTRPMGNLSRTFQSRGEELWPPRRRSLRKSQEFTYDYIQLLYEGKRRSYGTVERIRGSKKLLCSPSWADVSVLASCYSEQSKGNIYRSYLAHRNLVSNLTKDIQKDNNVSKKFAQKLALVRTLKQQRLGLCSVGSGRCSLLDVKGLCLSVTLADTTLQEYTRVYAIFRGWLVCTHSDYNEHSMTDFVAYLLHVGKGYLIDKVEPSLKFFADLEGWQLLKDSLYYRVKTGALKLYNLCDRNPLQRDPVMADYIKNYITQFKPKTPNEVFNYNLTCALLVIGFRVLCRPSEISQLQWDDITFITEGRVKVNLAGHKTDKNARDTPMIVDPIKENPEFCPVAILTKYMNMVKKFKKNTSPLFSYRDNKFLSRQKVQSIIQSAIRKVKPEAKITGHSLRIGGATEMVKKGENMDAVKVAGRWKSDSSALLYMRKQALAEKNMSTTLMK
ncbi:hypothetical protein C9374_010237 [Naegleria lovaniensis]|uniref:Tyr recombinase domain-containing protein n=1 Tax=Naegleria lovaniensis TaxID=51637 RepID=A0AA88GHB7_NAELO|nr:uncharacterized protein C9374_010237 [Naegleria lovaniensis]KAG2374863.1 hypothetical protein C9374_010237 [Naegleria lovaniensis]